MTRTFTRLVAAFIVVIGATAFTGTAAIAADVTLYKMPQCGCCDDYADYLREYGHTVTVMSTDELFEMSRAAGIPDEFQGCHLSYLDDYVVSGHVPVDIVNRLLAERPDIKGITLPGMPMGSPGMSGTKAAPFTIYEINTGRPRVYAVE